MATIRHYPRFLRPRLLRGLSERPIVLIHGPRQSGKSTLARETVQEAGYAYISFDDDALLVLARKDPVGFAQALPMNVIVDEVQRAPEIVPAIRAVAGHEPIPGRFILIGSTNAFLVPGLTDAPLGLMEIMRLHPLAQSEIEGTGSRFIDDLFGDGFREGMQPRSGVRLSRRIARGGYPAALTGSTTAQRAVWCRRHIETVVQRDIGDLAPVISPEQISSLLALAAKQTGRLINIVDLTVPLHPAEPSVRGYVTLLARVFMLEGLPPWHNSRLTRLVRTSKLHFCDSGLAGVLLGSRADSMEDNRDLFGQVLESFVLQELRRHASWRDEYIGFHHFGEKSGAAVDIVMEQEGQRVAGLSVKAGEDVTSSDFRGLSRLKDVVGGRFSNGVILYDGEVSTSFGDSLYAVPIQRLWQGA